MRPQARGGIAASDAGKKITLPGLHQPRDPPSLRPAEFSPSPAQCYEVFFGARVAIQPQTTSAIIAARKIPSSAMLFLRRPAWGWHQVLRSNAESLAALPIASLASSRL